MRKPLAQREQIKMKILTELIESLRGKDYPVKEVLTGAYWTAVVSQGCGLASTFREVRGVRRVTMMKK